MIDLQAQIDAVERLIEDLRWARGDPTAPEHVTYLAMKAVARDLRGRLEGKAGEARAAIGSRIADAVRSATVLGYRDSHMIGLAQEVIGRWPTIEFALEAAERTGQSATTTGTSPRAEAAPPRR